MKAINNWWESLCYKDKRDFALMTLLTIMYSVMGISIYLFYNIINK